MSEWPVFALGDLIDFFDSRRIPLSGIDRAKRQGGFPYYGASGIIDWIDDYIFDGRYLLVAEDGENLNSRKTPIAFFAEGKFWVNNHAHIICGKAGVLDDVFLQQWFAQADISAYVTGAAQPKLSQANMKRIKFPLPPFPAQRKIAAILSAYDDLIENTNSRIKLLEEMTQRIYREWFVDFRYPGHEDVPLADSELGPIPEGWTVATLSTLAEAITRGVSPKYADSSDQLVINQKCIRDGALDLAFARHHVTRVPSTKMVRLGDVLINSTGVGTLGRVTQVLFEPSGLTVDSHVTIARPLPAVADRDFLGVTLLAREPELAVMGVGSTGQTELGRTAIGEMKVVVPPLPCQRKFSDTVAVIRRLPISLVAATATLRATRDLLLPRLISAEIDVTELDIAMPEVAA